MKQFPTVWTVVFFLIVAGASGLAGAAPLDQSLELVSRIPPSEASDTGAYAQRHLVQLPPSISHDGRYVAFAHTAANLVPGQQDENAGRDVFLKDLVTGTTILVSRVFGSETRAGNRPSMDPVISGDGRYVAFLTAARDLAPGQVPRHLDSRQLDLLLFDRVTGTTSVVFSAFGEVAAQPVLSADGRYVAFALLPFSSDVLLYDRMDGTYQVISDVPIPPTESADALSPSISADGRYVAFTHRRNFSEEPENIFVYDRNSGALTLAGPGQEAEISADGRFLAIVDSHSFYLFDRVTGVKTLLSEPSSGFLSYPQPTLSADGRFVAFLNNDASLFPPQPGNPSSGLFVYDRISMTFTRVTETTPSFLSVISGNGRFVAFTSFTSNLVPGLTDTNGSQDVFLFDRVAGTTRLVSHMSASASTTGNAPSYVPTLSRNGARVAFVSEAADLVADLKDLNQGPDVFAYDTSSGTNLAVTRRAAEMPSLSPVAVESTAEALSADGRWVIFASSFPHVIPGQEDSNRDEDLFLYDRATRATVLVSRAAGSATRTGNGRSVQAALSADGRYVAFASSSSDLVPGLENHRSNRVFLFDRITGTTRLIGPGTSSPLGSGSSLRMSPDGAWVAFVSDASSLVPGQQEPSFEPTDDVFLWDRQTGRTVLVSRTSAGAAITGNRHSFQPELSSDGRYVAFLSNATDIVPGQPEDFHLVKLFLHDRVAGSTVLVSRVDLSSSADPFSLSADGRFLAYAVYVEDREEPGPPGPDTYLYDRVLGTRQRIAPHGARPRLSADGRYVTFHSIIDQQVYLHDRVSQTTSLITGSALRPGSPSDRDAHSQEISADGRYVAFFSTSRDLIPGQLLPLDSEDSADLFLFDRISGTTLLVSRSQSSPLRTTNGGGVPLLSASGRQVAFTSFAGLVNGDFNVELDAYVFSLDPPPPVTLPNCKLLDTRRRAERPVLTSNVQRTVTAHGRCGVPATAKQVIVKVTVFNPSGKGNLRFYPGAVTANPSGILRFERGATRMETFTLPLSTNGTLMILPFVAGRGTVHVAVEVNGYSE
jgi:Tol biopolymer transport system component